MAYKGKHAALIEAAKEGFRIALFAGLSALVAWGTTQLNLLDPNSTFVVIGTVVLRLADKFLHEDDTTDLKGLSPV